MIGEGRCRFMNAALVNGVGVAAALCSMASFLPQVLKIWREKDASSVSLRMCVVTVIGFGLWAAYGGLLKSWPLIGSNLFGLSLSAAVLILKLCFGDGPKQKPRS
jgi:MtN3 and saliva related transmembrane protein